MGKKVSFEEKVVMARKIHGDKYSYPPQPECKTNKDKLIIVCPEHGPFTTNFNDHIFKKSGCPDCAKIAKIEPSRERAQQMWAKKKAAAEALTIEKNDKPNDTNRQPYIGSKGLFW